MKIIALANQKGGVTKTTTTAHLAWGLANKGKRVLAIDLDPQGNLTAGMGLSAGAKDFTVLNWMGLAERKATFEETVQRSGNVDVIPANIFLDNGELMLVAHMGREGFLKRALEPVKKMYDYVLIDCRPSLGILSVNALTAADEVLVPMKPAFYCLLGIGQLIDNIKMVRRDCNPKLKFNGFLLTLVDKRRNDDDTIDNIVELSKSAKCPVYETQIRASAAGEKVSEYGISLYEFKPDATTTQDYLAFVDEFLTKENGNA